MDSLSLARGERDRVVSRRYRCHGLSLSLVVRETESSVVDVLAIDSLSLVVVVAKDSLSLVVRERQSGLSLFVVVAIDSLSLTFVVIERLNFPRR